jgi:hypothetical protein
VTGWTQFGLMVWLPVAAVLALAGGFVWLLLAAGRHFVRWCCDERTETRDQRRTTPAPDECWISPDEELEFEEITGPLGVELEARRQARYGDDGPRLTLGGGPC